ncbi:MAG TPA: hypothetical protein VGJ26_06960, partial [Pirellulales bacterium]
HRLLLTAIASGAVLVSSGLVLSARISTACPFCSSVSMTLAEEMKSSDAAVIAKLVTKPTSPDDAGAPTKSKFEIVRVLKGEAALGGKKQIEMLYFGQQEPGTKFLIFGIDPKELMWGTPSPVTDKGIKYLDKVVSLPAGAVDRLAFFQEYLEDEDTWLQSDAFNEFATTPYPDVVALKDRMHRDQLLKWIADDKIPASRRRLYFTMLGVCGKPEDLPMIEQLIQLDDRQVRTGLDAMIGCYLSLKGPEGLPLIEEMFLKNPKSEYVDTYAAIYALRILGQETTVVSRERLAASLRLMLERPQLADMVIPDLARWQDWSVVDRVVKLFKDANEESSWVRVPVVQYLRACPLPVAKEHLVELAKIDPDAVKRANSFFPLTGSATQSAAKDPKGTDAKGTDAKAVATPAAEPAKTPATSKETKPATKPVTKSELDSADAKNPVPAPVLTGATGAVSAVTDSTPISDRPQAASAEPAATSAKPAVTSGAIPTTEVTPVAAKPAPSAEPRSPVFATLAMCLAVATAGSVLFRMKRGQIMH